MRTFFALCWECEWTIESACLFWTECSRYQRFSLLWTCQSRFPFHDTGRRWRIAIGYFHAFCMQHLSDPPSRWHRWLLKTIIIASRKPSTSLSSSFGAESTSGNKALTVIRWSSPVDTTGVVKTKFWRLRAKSGCLLPTGVALRPAAMTDRKQSGCSVSVMSLELPEQTDCSNFLNCLWWAAKELNKVS